MADPDLKVGWGGGGGGEEGREGERVVAVFFCLPCRLFSFSDFFFFPKNKRGPGLSPRSATADVTDEN